MLSIFSSSRAICISFLWNGWSYSLPIFPSFVSWYRSTLHKVRKLGLFLWYKLQFFQFIICLQTLSYIVIQFLFLCVELINLLFSNLKSFAPEVIPLDNFLSASSQLFSAGLSSLSIYPCLSLTSTVCGSAPNAS